MILRFKVKTETVTITVDPNKIPKRFRFPLAERLAGPVDVVQLWNSNDGTSQCFDGDGNPIHIEAAEPTLPSLLDAIRDNDIEAEQRRHRHCNLAWSLAAGITDSSLKQYDESCIALKAIHAAKKAA